MDTKELFIVEKDTFLVDAMQRIDDNSKGIVFVINENKQLCGALTDGDVRRWLLKTGELTVAVSEIMNRNPKYLYEGDSQNPIEYMNINCIRAIPIVNSKLEIRNIALADIDDKVQSEIMKLTGVPVIIMAGGKGTRLYPYTKILPKPLIPIGDIPILERIINNYCAYGINRFFLTVNYKKAMISSYFSEIGHAYQIEYVEEDVPLGTAGSIRLINEKFDKPLFVTNCDTLIRADYGDIYAHHISMNNAITIVSAMKNDVIPYGVIHSMENGEIDKIEEKPCRSYFINTGMYVMNPEMIGLIPEGIFFHMTDLIEKALEAGLKVGMYPVSDDSFLDMGEFEEMKRMEEKLKY